MQNMKSEEKIDYNLYSRQIIAYGAETQTKLSQLKVFVHGLRGVSFFNLYDNIRLELRPVKTSFLLAHKKLYYMIQGLFN